jgi:hypothetical protein
MGKYKGKKKTAIIEKKRHTAIRGGKYYLREVRDIVCTKCTKC